MRVRMFFIVISIVIVSLVIGISMFLSSFLFPCRSIKSLPVLKIPLGIEAAQLEASLTAHVETLAKSIGERNLYKREQLYETAKYIKDFWENLGFDVQTQTYDVKGAPYQNIWVQIDGNQNPGEIILIGAHYDSAIEAPGADDNATGVGALLEISKLLKEISLSRSIRFVAFVNEEPPFFKSTQMGSRVYAAEMARNKEQVVAMISLESIGYFSDQPGSQKYPPFLNLFYPNKGNFLAVVGNFESRNLIKKITRYFKEGTELPCECIAAPSALMGIDWSDHASFWEHGYPAVMATDTVPYRNPHYHEPTDKPDTLNYPAYTKATAGLAHAIYHLANE